LTEFAEFGMAGAGVDRLAHRAGISPGLVYAFYMGRDELFDVVFDQVVELTVSTVPIDADHLPEYAGMLHDTGVEDPEVVRFLMWYYLERGEFAQRAAVTEAMRDKIDAIRQPRAAAR
jgi:AcrR family transcriptional regulator